MISICFYTELQLQTCKMQLLFDLFVTSLHFSEAKANSRVKISKKEVLPRTNYNI